MIPIAPATSAFTAEKHIEIERKKRTRAKRSCDACRIKKIRCDADDKQPCTKCKLTNTNCQFLIEQKKRGPASGRYVEQLENRLIRMEKLLQNITKENKQDHSTTSENEDETMSPSNSCTLAKLKSTDQEQELMQEQLEGLTVSDYQRTRYLGASSGLHFLNEDIFTTNKKKRLLEEPSWFIQKLNEEEEEHVIIKSKEVSIEDIQNNKTFNRIEAFRDIPHITQDFVDYLVHLYFTRVHNYCPIINKIQFLEQYYYHSPSPPDKYLLYTIASIGISIFKTDSNEAKVFHFTSEQVDEMKETIKIKSQRLLGIVCKRTTISTVQALMIMSMFIGYDKNVDEETSHWFISGTAIRLAQDLGLHRDCSKWKIPQYEIELRRRIWYGCYLMDRLVAAELGRPISIIDDEFDVELPSPYELNYTSNLNKDTDFIPILVLEAEEALRQNIPVYSAFVHLLTITHILGETLVGLHSTRVKKQDQDKKLELVNTLEHKLANWKSTLPPELQIIDLNNNDSTAHYITTPALVINIVYGCVSILLYRPFIRKQIESSNIAFKALSICTDTAIQLINIVEIMDRNYLVALPWSMSVYSIFQAAIILLHNAKGENEFLRKQGRHYLIKCSKMCKNDSHFQNTRMIEVLMSIVKNFDVSMEDTSPSQKNDDEIMQSGNKQQSQPFSSSNDQYYTIINNDPNLSLTGPAMNPYIIHPSFDSSSKNIFLPSNPNGAIIPTTTYDLASLSSQVPLWDIPNGVMWSEWEIFLRDNIIPSTNTTI
ncbi:fungal-specific transcription factor domain-containing protein [Cokeromyces recurvatus]|uniref:fungal-specific transcription factor domain-containing protein n=1 Tax=Cokeromyces recurvatus TaxID=90255 RepID=UPI0022207894|nr:fungal-specific transcription factor domain-containing protein [Cokeromyces recurvatus]KAI7902086.1 fungal-specific transcription factor domain-containing protein [Cokeromyces recurvatus]